MSIYRPSELITAQGIMAILLCSRQTVSRIAASRGYTVFALMPGQRGSRVEYIRDEWDFIRGLKPGDLITPRKAAEMLGCGRSRLSRIARRENFREIRLSDSGDRAHVRYFREDIERRRAHCRRIAA